MRLGNQHQSFGCWRAIRSCLIALWLLSCLPLCAAAPPSGNIVYSSNKRFFAEFSQFDSVTIQVAVFDTASTQPSLLWTKRFTPSDPLGGIPADYRTVLVSNDGNAVIYHEYPPWGNRNDLFVLHKKFDQYWDPYKISAQLESEKHDHALVPKRDVFAGDCMEFLLEDQKSSRFALWLPNSDRWFVLSLATGEPENPSEATIAELNSQARAKALVAVESANPSAFQSFLDPLARHAASIIPGVKTNANSRYLHPDQKIAYRFLAARRIPADRKYLNQLFAWPIERTYTTPVIGWNEVRIFFQSEERNLADLLLAQWNGIATNLFIDPEPYPIDPYQQHFYLGRIYGKAKLPIPASPKSGLVWLLLIPDDIPLGEWAKSTAVLVARLDLNNGFAANLRHNLSFEEVEFVFGTLFPGAYRLKAIWDHRSPIAPASAEHPALSPGDYESAESGPYKIKAGELLEDIVLECTNRVGEADAYYAADEKWKEIEGANARSPSQSSFLHPMGELLVGKEILVRPANEWLLKTNQNQISAVIRKIALIESATKFCDNPVQQLRMRISVPRHDRNNQLSYRCVLSDDHGCAFSGTVAELGPSTILVEWRIFPRWAPAMQLRIVDERTSYGGRVDPEASFMIKNLVRSRPANWQPEAFPISHNLDLVRVELRSLTQKDEVDFPFFLDGKSPPVWFPQPAPRGPDFAFFHDGEQTMKWEAESIYYQDRWGNTSDKTTDFCKEEHILKLKAQFRRRRSAQFSDEEKWVLPVASIPAAGEFALIEQSKQLEGATLKVIAITGTGEFTYEGDRIVTATNHISSNFDGPLAAGSPVLFLWNSIGDQNVYGKGDGTIVSLVPHVSVRFSGLTPKQEFFLLEESDTLFVSRNELQHRNNLRFLPLNRYSFDDPRNLTFIVQNLREADFIVPVR
jgi:hypothetical protein